MAAGDSLLSDQEKQIINDGEAYLETIQRQGELEIARARAVGSGAMFADSFQLSITTANEILDILRDRVSRAPREVAEELSRALENLIAIVPPAETNSLVLESPTELTEGSSAPILEIANIEDKVVKQKAAIPRQSQAPKQSPSKPIAPKQPVAKLEQTKTKTAVDSKVAEASSEQDQNTLLSEPARTYLNAMTGKFFDTTTLKVGDVEAISGLLLELKPAPRVVNEATSDRQEFYKQVLEHRLKNISPVKIAEQLGKKPQDVNNALFQIKDSIVKAKGSKEVAGAFHKLFDSSSQSQHIVPEQAHQTIEEHISSISAEPDSATVDTPRPVPSPPTVPFRPIIPATRVASPESQISNNLVDIVSKNLELDETDQELVGVFFSKSKKLLNDSERARLNNITARMRDRIVETYNSLIHPIFKLTQDERVAVNRTLGFVYDAGALVGGPCVPISEYVRKDGDIDRKLVKLADDGYAKVIPKLWVA